MRKKNVEFEDLREKNLDRQRRNHRRAYHNKITLIKFFPAVFLFFLVPSLLFRILLSVGWILLATMFFDHRDIFDFVPSIRVWFGVPGSGKTSVAAWLTQNSFKSGYRVLSNVDIKNAYQLTADDLGKYDMSFDGDGCHVIFDEASLEFDSRNYKTFSKSNYFALHRHMNNRVDIFSQGYDIDKRIRDRASSNGLFYLRRLPFPGFVMYRKIKRVLFIKKDDKQMVDGFDFYGLPKFVYTRSVWDCFDTLDMSLCPTEQKEWKKW